MSQVGPELSRHFASRQPSAIRVAGIRFAGRAEAAKAVNVAIGNVSLPMHPAMIDRMGKLGETGSPFAGGAVQYTATVGIASAQKAFLHVLESSGVDTSSLQVQVTDGGSQAMELLIVGCCGQAGSSDKPLMLIDAAYTNYTAFAERLGRATTSIARELSEDGSFALPPISEIEKAFDEQKPGALVVIPYDNPTGQLYDRETLIALAKLCVSHGVWIISDEAYRELFYTGGDTLSIWSLTEEEVPGIAGHRISIETASKVWNACGLRIGAIVTDNAEYLQRSVAENTASLCPNHIGQWIFGAIGEVSKAELHTWYDKQRAYYRDMMVSVTAELQERLPGVIVSRPDASLYSVVDVRQIAQPGFDALNFVLWCAEHGAVEIGGEPTTLLTAPMAGFYNIDEGAENPGLTQMRIAYVESPEQMALVPHLFAELFIKYEEQR